MEREQLERKIRRYLMLIPAFMVLFIVIFLVKDYIDYSNKKKSEVPFKNKIHLNRIGKHDVAGGEKIFSYPVIKDGYVYLISETELIVVNNETMEVEKRIPVEGTDHTESPPYVEDDRITVFTGEGNIYSIDKHDYSTRWQKKLPLRNIENYVVDDGIAYIAYGGVNVIALNLDTGEELWNFQYYEYHSSSNVALLDDSIYLAHSAPNDKDEYRHFVLDKYTGRIVNSVNLDEGSPGIPVINEDKIFISGHHYLTSIDKYSLSKIWNFKVPYIVQFHSQPVIKGNFIYFGDYKGNFYTVNKDTGELKWKLNLSNGTKSSRVDTTPAILDDLIFVKTEDGVVQGIDINTGEKIWELETKEALSKDSYNDAVVVKDDVLYITTDDGYLYKYTK